MANKNAENMFSMISYFTVVNFLRVLQEIIAFIFENLDVNKHCPKLLLAKELLRGRSQTMFKTKQVGGPKMDTFFNFYTIENINAGG